MPFILIYLSFTTSRSTKDLRSGQLLLKELGSSDIKFHPGASSNGGAIKRFSPSFIPTSDGAEQAG